MSEQGVGIVNESKPASVRAANYLRERIGHAEAVADRTLFEDPAGIRARQRWSWVSLRNVGFRRILPLAVSDGGRSSEGNPPTPTDFSKSWRSSPPALALRVVASMAVAVLTFVGALPALASPVTVIDIDVVFRGGAGESQTWSWPTGDLVGDTCSVAYQVLNGASRHFGNTLDITSNGDALRQDAIEVEPFGVTPGEGTLTLGSSVDATVTLSDNPAHAWRSTSQGDVYVFSGRLIVTVDCTPVTTTSSSVPSTTTTVPAVTTTTVPGQTTTTVTDETTTTGGTATSIASTTSTTIPPVSDCVPDPADDVTCDTLPFTGSPVEAAGLAMAAAALLMLGSGVVTAVKERSS